MSGVYELRQPGLYELGQSGIEFKHHPKDNLDTSPLTRLTASSYLKVLKKGLNYTIKGTGNFDGIVVPFNYKANLI